MAFDRSVDGTPDRDGRGAFRPRQGNAQHRGICETIESSDPVRAEGMMRKLSHAMIECIRTFVERGKSLTVADLIALSAADPPPPAA